MTILHGIDISRHNGPIDWERLAPNVDEVLIRGTMGAAGWDDAYAENWRESGWAGITRRAPYHLATSLTPWRGQRDNIARVTRGDFGTIAVTLDVERTKADRLREAGGWIFPRQQYTDDLLALGDWLLGEAPGGVNIYSNESEIRAMTTQTPELLRFGFHGAGYPLSSPMTFARLEQLAATYKLAIPLPWLTADAWQGASTGRLPGIAGNVDMSLIYNTAAPTTDPLPALLTPAETVALTAAAAGIGAARLSAVTDRLEELLRH